MKNKILGIFIFLYIIMLPSFVYGADLNYQIVEFNVTSGVELGQTESTFDKTRTITGSSENGSFVSISLSKKNTSGVLNEYANYSIEIGPTGLFSQTVELELGENIVSITAEKNGKAKNTGECTVRRKKREIKTELETGISIPGMTNIIGIY